MFTLTPLRRRYRISPSSILLSFFIAAASLFSASVEAQRLVLSSRTFSTLDSDIAAADAGPVPSSQPLSLTLHLASTPERAAALDQLLEGQVTSSSASYHKWITPAQFAAAYGATDDQIATLTSWVESHGLAVTATSPGRARLTVSGTAAQVERAFAVSLQRFQVSGKVHFANTTQPSLPEEIAPLVTAVSGLNDMPVAASALSAGSLSTLPRAVASSSGDADALISAATAIDTNLSPVLTLTDTTCSTDLGQSDYDAYRALFRQASAQGITVLAPSGCGARGTGSFPGSLAEVTSITEAPAATPFVPIAPRPTWQSAPGLPEDGSRYEPDLTTGSASAFAQTVNTIVQQTGSRQGNINSILYSLATTPDLYAQPDNAPAGTWEPATGLGVVDLQKLLKVFPRATGTATTTTLAYSGSSAIGYGTQVVLTASVTPSAFNVANPSGTVTFTSSPQGIIGSGPLTNGTATLSLGALAVGSYTITASYSGDGNYAGSTSATPVSIVVNIVNASLTATISPSSKVPYGSTGTVTATVVLPNSSGAPAGTVSATVEAVTGALYTATLSPNPGGNTATANIVVAAPAPNSTGYTVEVSCAGNANFQCQSPVDINGWTTVMGNTLTTLSVNPAAPQAGQPVTLTAAINNAGNATGAYAFSGSVVFYDNGVILATAPVATNQASISKTLSGNIQHSIVAKYSGDAKWNGSNSAPLSVAPTLLPSSLTVTANTYSTLAGINIVFTATAFTTVGGTVGPTGTVTFYDTFNGSVAQLGIAAPLASNGPNQSIAIFSTTGLQAGTHSVYAIYNGDTNFNAATSSPLALTLSDYTLNMNPQTLTVRAGQTGKLVILLGAIGGFNGTVSFGCTPPSNSETTCSFSPLTLSGGGSTTMSIVTTAAKARPVQQAGSLTGPGNPWGVGIGGVFAAMLCFIAPRRRRAIPGLLLLLLAATLSVHVGCGQGTSASTTPEPATPSDPGTPLGTQIFTITTAGSDGINTVRHNYQYQVTVQ